ncbi:MAG: hypothetical protein ACRDT4_09980, partial [Micromonosporaceae bacterium]
MTDQNRDDETAQPRGAAQSGQAGGGSGAERSGEGFVVRDKRHRPSPRPRPAPEPTGTNDATSGEADVPDKDKPGTPAHAGASGAAGDAGGTGRD